MALDFRACKTPSGSREKLACPAIDSVFNAAKGYLVLLASKRNNNTSKIVVLYCMFIRLCALLKTRS